MLSEEDITEFIKTHSSCILIFKGSVDHKTGQNWCSDCVEAEPYINQFLMPQAEKFKIPVKTYSVGDRETWKNPDHFLRKHPKFRLKGVPSICFIEDQVVIKQLIEAQCQSEEFLLSLFD